MFHNIRDKFHNLQENITTALRGLSINEQLNKKSVKEPVSVNLSAGAQLIEKFQTSWAELHNSSFENAKKAEVGLSLEVDRLIGSLHKSTEKEWKNIAHLSGILMSLPEIVNLVDDMCNKTVVLKELFNKVENSLSQLQEIIETRNFQNKQLEERFQLALYEEKRLKKLDSLKFKLEEEFQDKIKTHEASRQKLLKECQEASEENFKQDIQFYKETNMIPTIEFAKKEGKYLKLENSLEDIILDKEDTSALDEFLNDSKDEENDVK